MDLLERVRERTQSELSDGELQELIDEAQGEIERRYGTVDDDGNVAESFSGGYSSLFLTRPATEIVSVTENDGDSDTVLVAEDYRLHQTGRRVERLTSGVNPGSKWADSVGITYKPVDDQKQRDEVIIKLVKLSLEYEGVKAEGADGYRTDQLDFQAERNKLLASLDRSLRMA